MDLLFRLSIDGFLSVEDTKIFFLNILPKRDNNYFFHTRKISHINQEDIIYFSYNGYMVAKAIFDGQIVTDKDRDEKFIKGHKLKNIQIINSSVKLDTNIIREREIRYVKTKNINTVMKRLPKNSTARKKRCGRPFSKRLER